MNYTYLPSSPFSQSPVIVMTTNPASKKMNNLITNPNVSLLVHDWVSHRPPTSQRRMSGGSPGPEHRSSLASLLLNLNTSAMSSISATINGAARLVDAGSDEEQYYRQQHLENNTFDSEGSSFGAMFQGSSLGNGNGNVQQQQQGEDGGRGCFVAGEEVRVIVVGIQDVRIADWKGGVRDWVITPGQQGQAQVNGVP
ncbi:putative pyridoxamine phosphate oxidase protein [Phaeoacremonium minimum UCRPA7]|uniref:Putative pyridoxamine phosphate oxidase protein n=1 Tax=Phaeoacremonium minimum (strain UCR-PA7) TaxID=1286976 RepID=R8BQP7_PHAM7|nr:putative pyridoxamine phosphate oxidase protein [Phaeoacremonium minimum UCRPA7]EOO01703.1 putative pyridoxamine phosphate oxidase protein [Phaeoacremonium minimum UCRPA7]